MTVPTAKDPPAIEPQNYVQPALFSVFMTTVKIEDVEALRFEDDELQSCL